MKKILMLVPAYTAKGGISNYYKSLEGKFNIPVEYLERGARNWPNHDSKIKEVCRLFYDWYKCYKKLRTKEYSILQTSTSLGSLSVLRDGVFLYIARLMGLRTVVFYRGWDYRYKLKLENDRFAWRFFFNTFLKADTSIVLSSAFRNDLLNWGYRGNISIETTIVAEELISFSNVDTKYDKEYKPVFLFLSRVEVAKGIYETVDAYEILKQKYPDSRLIIAGDGFELDNVKKTIKERNIKDVDFRGFVRGEDKIKSFYDGNIYIFPSYTEGMPNSVLEAMAFGIPIIATPVGGLIDILKDNDTGFFIKEKSHIDIVDKASIIINNVQLRINISKYNKAKANNTFTTSKVVERLESIFKQLYN